MTRASTRPSVAPSVTVLLVDDDPHVLQSLRRVLRRQPYKVLIASSPQEALRLLAVNRVAVVVTNQHMPEMLGSEFLQRVGREFPAVVTILLTGGDSPAVRACVPWRTLMKPVSPAELFEALREAVKAA